MDSLNFNPASSPNKKFPLEYGLVLLILFFIGMLTLQWTLVRKGEITVVYSGKIASVPYRYFVPPSLSQKPIQVLVASGDIGGSGKDFLSAGWLLFSVMNRVAIVAPEFPFSDEDWEAKESFQFPEAWSGLALINILDEIAKKSPAINRNRLFLMGFAAGGQFAARFASWRPNLARAVAVHGTGDFDIPRTFIPVYFLVTVGQLDEARVAPTQAFVDAAHTAGMLVEHHIILNTGHKFSHQQIRLTRDFFKKILAVGS